MVRLLRFKNGRVELNGVGNMVQFYAKDVHGDFTLINLSEAEFATMVRVVNEFSFRLSVEKRAPSENGNPEDGLRRARSS